MFRLFRASSSIVERKKEKKKRKERSTRKVRSRLLFLFIISTDSHGCPIESTETPEIRKIMKERKTILFDVRTYCPFSFLLSASRRFHSINNVDRLLTFKPSRCSKILARHCARLVQTWKILDFNVENILDA